MRVATARKERPGQMQVDQWWGAFLRQLRFKDGVTPCAEFRYCSMLPIGTKVVSLQMPLLPAVEIVLRMSYERISADLLLSPQLFRQYVDRTRQEINALSHKTELGRAMAERKLQLIRLRVIDTVKKGKHGASNYTPVFITEKTLK